MPAQPHIEAAVQACNVNVNVNVNELISRDHVPV